MKSDASLGKSGIRQSPPADTSGGGAQGRNELSVTHTYARTHTHTHRKIHRRTDGEPLKREEKNQQQNTNQENRLLFPFRLKTPAE